MVSYWERQAEERRRRSLSAQAARYSGQAAQFDNVSRSVGAATGMQTNSVLEAQRRRAEQAERDRIARVRREQAEARAAAARADRERREVLARNEEAARRAQENAARGPGFVLPTGGLGPGFQPSMEDYAEAGRVTLGIAEEAAFGPERQSVFGGEASRGERTLRDWGLSEQEFRTAGERFGEGRPLAGLGWGALGLAGAVPFFGQVGRGVAGAVRGVGAAADVGRAAGAAADVGRAAGRASGWAIPPGLDDLTRSTLEFQRSAGMSLDEALESVNRTRRAQGLEPISAAGESAADVGRGAESLRSAKPFDAVEAGFEYGEAINRSLKVDDVPEVMYHVAPRAARESIQSSGLSPQGTWNTGVGRWPGMTYANDAVRTADTLEPSVYRPDGVYMFENIEDAREFARGDAPFDIYEIRTGDIFRDGGRIIRDPESVGRFAAVSDTFVTRVAPPDYVSRLDSTADVDRAAGAAADVGRVVSAPNIADDVANEFRSNIFRYTADPERLARAGDYQRDTIEILHRQGFDKPPSVISRNQFDELAQSGEYIPIYRGVRDYEGVPAQRFVDEFNKGEFFIGGGALGNGAYFTTSPALAESYRSTGNIIEALVPNNARLFDLDSLDAQRVLAEKNKSPFRDMADFLAANGYDGLRSGDNIVLYNRSAAIVPRG